MSFEVKVDAKRVQVRLDAMPDNVRTELRGIVQTLDNELLARVQDKTPFKTGKLRDSFRAHVRSSKTRVSGTVNVDKSIRGERGIAAIMESGANVPAHDIMPDVAQALSFAGSTGGLLATMFGKRTSSQIFAAVVHHPADVIPAVHMMADALAEMEGEIVTEIEDTVRNALASG